LDRKIRGPTDILRMRWRDSTTHIPPHCFPFKSCPTPEQGCSSAPLRGPTPASAASRRCRGRGAALRTNRPCLVKCDCSPAKKNTPQTGFRKKEGKWLLEKQRAAKLSGEEAFKSRIYGPKSEGCGGTEPIPVAFSISSDQWGSK